RQPDVAGPDAAFSKVEIVLVDREWIQIVETRRIAEAADLDDVRAALELFDVPNARDERIGACAHARRSDDRDLARRRGVEASLDDAAALQIGDIRQGEFEIAAEQAANVRSDRRAGRSDKRDGGDGCKKRPRHAD